MADEIRNWFVNHQGNDFTVPSRDHPYSVIPTPTAAGCVLYTTKPSSVIAALSQAPAEFPCGVIGRYGLPSDDDLDCFASLVGQRKFLFMGDVDPVDMLTFSWLRSRIDISFQGLNDTLLELCGVTLDDRILSEQSDAEHASIPLVTEYVPDHADLLGSTCAEIFASGRKVEVESVTAFATESPGVLAKAIVT